MHGLGLLKALVILLWAHKRAKFLNLYIVFLVRLAVDSRTTNDLIMTLQLNINKTFMDRAMGFGGNGVYLKGTNT